MGTSRRLRVPDISIFYATNGCAQNPHKLRPIRLVADKLSRGAKEAGKKLSNLILDLHKQEPSARIHIIAHSHGGNVALYAMKTPGVQAAVDGLVCMSTPFLSCLPRTILTFTGRFADFEEFAAIMPLLIGIPATILLLIFVFSGPADWFWRTAALIPAVIVLALLRFFIRIMDTKGSVDIIGWARRRQTAALEKYSLGALPDNKLLLIGSRGDEALWWLRAITSVSELPYRLWAITISLANTFLIMMGVSLPFVMFSRKSTIFWDPMFIGFCGYVVTALFGILLFALLTIAPMLLRARLWGYGGEDILDSFFIKAGVRPVPSSAGSILFFKCRYPLLSSLKHARVYKDPKVPCIIADWLIGRLISTHIPRVVSEIAIERLGPGPGSASLGERVWAYIARRGTAFFGNRLNL